MKRNLAFIGILASSVAAAQVGPAPFCAVNSYGSANCYYYNVQACRQAAGPGGMCSMNPQAQAAQAQQGYYDIAGAMRDPTPSYQNGYNMGAAAMHAAMEARRARQAQEERRAQEENLSGMYHCMHADGQMYWQNTPCG